MKSIIICTFLFFTNMCFGQIVANGKNLKDLTDDYVMVFQMISTAGVGKITWIGTWGIDTTGYAKDIAKANEMAAGKSLKTLTAEAELQFKKMGETCQIKNDKGETLVFRDYIGVFNALSSAGFSYKFKDAALIFGSFMFTGYVFERRR